MIRLILVIIFLIIFSLYSIADAIATYFIGQVDKNVVRNWSYKVVRVVLKMIAFISGVKVHVKGKENIDESKPLLIIANHRGIFDVITGYTLLHKPCAIVAKDSFLHVPLLNYWMKRIGCFFLDRNDLRSGIAMIVDSVEKINSGISVLIFPEGTRNKKTDTCDMLEFKSGAFKIAEKSNARILPVAFYGTEDVFDKHKPIIEKKDVYINIGKAFSLDELTEEERKDIGNYSRNIVLKLLMEVKGEKG